MLKFIRRALITLILILGLALALLWTPDTDKDEMIAKYGYPDSQFLELSGGANLHFRDYGNEDGPVLMLIHGNSASLHTWADMGEQLKGQFRIISMDLPGHGLTGPYASRGYSAASMHQAITELADHLGAQDMVIAGNSMGGWLTWRYALAHPKRTKGIILIDASGAVTEEKVDPYLAAKISRSKLGQLLTPVITPKSIVRKSLSQTIYDQTQITEGLIDRYWELARLPGNRDAMVDRMKVDREPAFWKQVSTMTIPTLIIWGEQDITVPVSHAHAFDKLIPNTTLKIYPDAAHLPMEEKPVQTAKDILEWYAAVFSEQAAPTAPQ